MGPTDLAVKLFGQSYNCIDDPGWAFALSSSMAVPTMNRTWVKQIVNDQGSVVRKIEPNWFERYPSPPSEFIRQALFMTVDDEEGTEKGTRCRI